VRIDRNAYSVPIALAYRDMWAKIYPDRIEIAAGEEVVARHGRCYAEGCYVLDPFHVLPLPEVKHRAVPEATALRSWVLPEVFATLRTALRTETRKPDREWIQVLRLMADGGARAPRGRGGRALAAGTPRYESVRLLLHGEAAQGEVAPVPHERDDLKGVQVAEPDLDACDPRTARA